MFCVNSDSRAKSVWILIQNLHYDNQIDVIKGAINGATEQCARIVEEHSAGQETLCNEIAKEIRNTKSK
jgi:hypothetical protein